MTTTREGWSADARKVAAGSRRVLGAVAYRLRRRVVNTVAGTALGRPAVRRLIPAGVRELADAGEGLSVTTHRASYVVQRRQADVTAWDLARQTSDTVTAALRQAGLEHFAMHLPFTRVARWGVRRDQFSALAQALAETLGQQGFYYQFDRGTRPRPVLDLLTAGELARTGGFTVFQYVRCTTTGTLHGAPDGCRIAVWDPSPDRATLVAPDRQSIVQEIDRDDPLALTERDRWDGGTEPALPGTDLDASAIEFPVDAVYLWVDDSDPRWRARRDAVRRELGLADSSTEAEGTVAAHLFRDRGELRASMRSLEMYAPWIRNVYLVTDDQHPAWLDLGHDRVKIVDHREIFADQTALPSFSSHAIGSQIHRIPGLSDRYLVMNDDVMFTAPVTPYDFFTPTGELKVFFSRTRRPDVPRDRQSPLELARLHSAELIERDFGRRASNLFAHAPIPQRKDVALEVAQRYSAQISATVQGRFRSATDVEPNSWLHLYTALFTGRGVAARIRYGYFNVGLAEVRGRLERHEYSDRLRVICLNDVPPPAGEEEADPEWLTTWLERTFPIPTAFETVDVQ